MHERINRLALAALVLAALSLGLGWALPSSARAAEFKAKMVMHRGGPPSEGFVYVSGNKVRSDMAGPTGLLMTISRGDKGLTWFVNPHRKEYVEVVGLVMGPVGAGNSKVWERLADRKEVGGDVTEGYACDKVLYTFHDKSKGTLLQWMARKLKYPIKSIFHGPSGLVTTKFEKIVEGPQDPSLFEVPQGYKLAARRTAGPVKKDKKP